MSNPFCKCGCGEEVAKRSYETAKQWAWREKRQLYRAKCAKSLPPPVKLPPPPLPLLISGDYSRGEMVGQPKQVPVVDEKYREFIRGTPCLIPGCKYPSMFHHQNEKAHGGKGALCSDYRGLPLCWWHHTEGGYPEFPYSYHGMGKVTGWNFWKWYGIDVEATIHRLNTLWLESGRKFKGE